MPLPAFRTGGKTLLEERIVDIQKVQVDDRHEVWFIPLDPYLPPYEALDSLDDDEVPGRRYRAELHKIDATLNDWQFARRPLSSAWVYAYWFQDGNEEPHEGNGQVRWMETPPEHRRKGYAALLLKGLYLRWSGLIVTDSCSAEGDAFFASL
jgi:hypothetical protein